MTTLETSGLSNSLNGIDLVDHSRIISYVRQESVG